MTTLRPGRMTGSLRLRSHLVEIGILICLFFGVVLGASAASVQQGVIDVFSYETPEVRIPPTSTPGAANLPLIPGVPPEPNLVTQAGCCNYPQWSRDSEWLLFIDAPDGPASAGLYGVPRAGGPLTLITSRVGVFSEDWSLVAYLEGGTVYVERWVDGTRWTIPSSGRRIYFSPSNEKIAWEIGSSSIQNQDVQVRTIWIADIDGTGVRELVTVHGGGFQGWSEGGKAIIVSGRLTPTGPAGLWRIRLEDGAGRLLFAIDSPKDVLLSPDGTWIAFTIAFEKEMDRNGLWVLPTTGDPATKLSQYGAYRWREEGRLVVIPLDLDAPGAYLTQFDIPGNASWTLTSPLFSSLPIANNDWEISPDGRWMVFLSSEDAGLYLLELPIVKNLP